MKSFCSRESLVLIACVIVVIGCNHRKDDRVTTDAQGHGGQPTSTPNGAQATRQYWDSLNSTIKEHEAIGERFSKRVNASDSPYKQPDGFIRLADDSSRLFREAADAVERLRVLNVDDEALLLGRKHTEVLRNAAQWWLDARELASDVRDFSNRSMSVDAGLEAFLSGFFGDPLGPLNDKRAMEKQYEERARKLKARLAEEVMKKNAEFKAREVSVRAVLSRRYQEEFPQCISLLK